MHRTQSSHAIREISVARTLRARSAALLTKNGKDVFAIRALCWETRVLPDGPRGLEQATFPKVDTTGFRDGYTGSEGTSKALFIQWPQGQINVVICIAPHRAVAARKGSLPLDPLWTSEGILKYRSRAAPEGFPSRIRYQGSSVSGLLVHAECNVPRPARCIVYQSTHTANSANASKAVPKAPSLDQSTLQTFHDCGTLCVSQGDQCWCRCLFIVVEAFFFESSTGFFQGPRLYPTSPVLARGPQGGDTAIWACWCRERQSTSFRMVQACVNTLLAQQPEASSQVRNERTTAKARTRV